MVEDRKVTLSSSDAGRFDMAFRSLARQANVAFVIEGRPVKEELSLQETASLPKAAQFSTILEVLCKRYDYEVVTGRNNRPLFDDVLLLRKKYTQTADIPGVTTGEGLAALQDIEHMMTRFGNISVDDRRQIVQNALNGLSAQQRRQLPSGIAISSLSPAQKSNFSRVGTYFYLGTNLAKLSTCRFLLAEADKFIFTSDGAEVNSPVIVSGKDRFGNITSPLSSLVSGVQISSRLLPRSANALTGRDARSPIPTLGDALSAVEPKSQAAPFLLQKPLTIFNKQAAIPSHFVNAVATVYGLRAARPSDTAGWYINKKNQRTSFDLSNVYLAVKDALPLPLLRAAAAKNQKEPISPTIMRGDARLRRNSITAQIKDRRGGGSRAANVAEECVRRLEILYRTKSKGRPGFRTTLKDLGPEAQQDFAVFVMASYLASLGDSLNSALPFYVSDFEHCYAIGSEQGVLLQVGLGRANANGTVSPVVSITVPRR